MQPERNNGERGTTCHFKQLYNYKLLFRDLTISGLFLNFYFPCNGGREPQGSRFIAFMPGRALFGLTDHNHSYANVRLSRLCAAEAFLAFRRNVTQTKLLM